MVRRLTFLERTERRSLPRQWPLAWTVNAGGKRMNQVMTDDDRAFFRTYGPFGVHVALRFMESLDREVFECDAFTAG